MKRPILFNIVFLKFIILFIIVILGKVAIAQEFSKLPKAKDSTYGYIDLNPIKLKKGGAKKSIDYANSFLSHLKTSNGQKLNLLIRFTVGNPAYNWNKYRLKFRNGLPVNGKLGLLDKYFFITERTKDTIILFVDIYNKGDLKIPVSLKVSND